MMVVTPVRQSGGMESAATVEFSRAARALASTARRSGLVAPSFRSPPGILGAARTIRLRPGGAVICVRLRGRPMVAVLADMIEGVVVTNGLESCDAGRVRTELWEAAGHDFEQHITANSSVAAPQAGAA